MQNPSNICPQCQSPIPADAPGGLCPACVLLGVAGRTNPSQAAAAAAPTMEEVAAAFPELEVLDILGQGGMGIVFKARQPRLDRFVALKVLPPALAAHPGFAERFTREARVLARLAHQNIVSIYDFGESAGFFYLIMEFVNGVNLRAAMRAGVTPEQALMLVPRICEALQFAHDHGVLHRDIKPENILLDTAGVPKLADFGIAKLAGEESGKTGLTATGAALGTAAYMAPEQVEKPATVDHRADIYSLGVVLYEMLTGELPLGRFAAPSEKSPVNQGVDEVVMRALEKERDRRQQSATEMKTQVEGASHGTPSPAASAAAAARPQEDLAPRLFRALTVLSAIGIPLTGMMGWDVPSPRHMVMLTILFGTLIGVSKWFGPELSKVIKFQPPADPMPSEPSGPGRKAALVGLGLMLTPMALLLLLLPWLGLTLFAGHGNGRYPDEFFSGHHILLSLVGFPTALAAIAGMVITLIALFKHRFRAPWFFWSTTLTALAVMLVNGRERSISLTSILCLGVIGYCVYHRREFFPALAASSSAAGTSPDTASNPWPHRLRWLLLSIVVLPVVTIFTGMLVPRLVMRHGSLAFASTPVAVCATALPFIVGAALYFGYRRTKPGADQATPPSAWDPWPKRLFILIVAVVGVPLSLLTIGIAVPAISAQGGPAPARPARIQIPQQPPRTTNAVIVKPGASVAANAPDEMIVPAKVDVHYSEADPNLPGIQKMTLAAHTPVGWVTDLSLCVRDEKGERELPYASFVVAQQSSKRTNAAPEMTAEAAWEFNTQDTKEGFFQLNAKLNKGSVGNSGGSTSEATPYKWEPHPQRSGATRQLTQKVVQQIFFMRGVPAENAAAKGGAEMYVQVKTRPLKPTEKVEGFQGFLGPDRFEKLGAGKARKKTGVEGAPRPSSDNTFVDLEKTANIPAPVPEPKPAAPSPEVSRLQDEKIRIAREQIETTRKRAEAGVAPVIEQAAAERDLALAEGRGNELLTASALVIYAEKFYNVAKERAAAGVGTSTEALEAERNLNEARLRLELARLADENKREPKTDLTEAATKQSRDSIANLREEIVRLAAQELATRKKQLSFGTASSDDLLLAERNMAVAEARGNELKIANALVAYAETRSNALKRRAESGNASSTEAAEAEQALNEARIRLEEARTKPGRDATDDDAPTPANTSGDPKAVRSQDQSIQSLRNKLREMRGMLENGSATELDVAGAERDLAIAEARGDTARAARAKVRYAEMRVRILQKQNILGRAEAESVNAAVADLDAAREEEKRTLQGIAAKP